MSLTDPAALVIIFASFAMSYINAAFAVGGAIVLIAAAGSVLPMTLVVPLHSAFMFGSLCARVWMFHQYMQMKIVIPFAVGAAIGSLAGANVFVSLPEVVIAFVIAGVILLAVWTPKISWRPFGGFRLPQPFFFVGVIHSFLSTVFAFGGLMHAIMVRIPLDRLQITGTISGALFFMGLFKVGSFILVGFDYRPYLALILAVFLVSFPGTWLGKRLALAITEAQFRLGFRVIMTVLAVRLLWKALDPS